MLQSTTSAMLTTNRELRELPPAPSQDPVSELQQIIYSFSTELSSYSKGLVETPTLVQSSRVIYENFRKNVQATEPTIISKSRKEFDQWESGNIENLVGQAQADASLDRALRSGKVAVLPGRKARLSTLLVNK